MQGVCLINYNARLYDPQIGRFMGADSMVEAPYSTQDWNRYTYVGNNPLSFSDPSGQCFLGCFWKSPVGRAGIALVAALLMQYEFLPAVEGAAFASSVSGTFINAGISGGVSGYISTGKLSGAIFGSLEAMSFAWVHFTKTMSMGFPENPADYTVGQTLGSAIMHGFVGGIFSAAEGSKFGSGFLAAGMSDVAASTDSSGFDVGDTLKHAVLGGLGSMLGGGKFANGAVTGAFGYLFNDQLDTRHADPCAGVAAALQCTTSSNPGPHDNGDCALNGCDDVRQTPPIKISVGGTLGAGPTLVVDLNSDGTNYVGAGPGLAARARINLNAPSKFSLDPSGSASGDLLTFHLGQEPMGQIYKFDIGGGAVIGVDFSIYFNEHGAAGGLSGGLVDGAGTSLTTGVRWRPGH
jgi:RHS repeat-associated protein